MFNTFLNPNNKASLTNIIDIVANSVSLIIEDEKTHTNVHDLFVNQKKIASASPISIINGLGLTTTQFEFDGVIDDNHIPGLESILDYLHNNYYNKLDPAITNNYFNVNKHLHNIYNDNYITNKIDKRKNINNYNHNINETNIVQKKNFTTNNITNNINKKINTYVDDTNITIKKDYSTRTYNNNNSKFYNHLYNNEYITNKKYDNRVVNNTNNVNKSIYNIDNHYNNLFKTVKHNTKKSYNFIYNEDNIIHKTTNLTHNNSNLIFKDQHISFNTDEYNYTKKIYATTHITNHIKKYDMNHNDNTIVKKIINNSKHLKLINYSDNNIIKRTVTNNKHINIINNIDSNITKRIVNNNEITNIKDININNTYTDFLFRRDNSKHDNRKFVILYQHHFLFQRKQGSNNTYLQTQIDTLKAQVQLLINAA